MRNCIIRHFCRFFNKSKPVCKDLEFCFLFSIMNIICYTLETVRKSQSFIRKYWHDAKLYISNFHLYFLLTFMLNHVQSISPKTRSLHLHDKRKLVNKVAVSTWLPSCATQCWIRPFFYNVKKIFHYSTAFKSITTWSLDRTG